MGWGFGFWVLGFGVQDFEFWAWGFGSRVSGFGFQASGLEFWVKLSHRGAALPPRYPA